MSEDSNELWSKIVREGVEDRVEVNQRMLIDKMLARYSSDFVIYRELIQNSDDAQSRSFRLQIQCDPPDLTSSYQSIQKSNFIQGFNQLFKNSFGLNTNENTFEESLNNCLINEIRTVNDGNIFNEQDWKRVITIAEGNTNIDAIGQFGVGFFSVFSYSEKPMIQSGKHCLAFAWQNGRSLTTFRKELSLNEQTTTTSIILPMKNKYLLQTKENLSSKAKKNLQTNQIIPTLNLFELKKYFTKVLCFTKSIEKLTIEINDKIVFQITKTKQIIEATKCSLASKQFNLNSSDHQFVRLNSFIETEQTFQIENSSSIQLNHLDVQATIQIDKQFEKQIEQIIKKQLPQTISIQFLFPKIEIFQKENMKFFEKNEILKEIIPLKFHQNQLQSYGQIFIGLSTHQTTGLGMHIFTHLIPTIERENIDLQDPYISIWNEHLLISIGQISRFVYDQILLNTINRIEQQSIQYINSILSIFSFEKSTPNPNISRLIVEGFFSLDKDLLVPVKRNPNDKYLSLIPSTEAFLPNSKYIERFLSIPLVPFELSQNEFFSKLKQYRFIEQITFEIILNKIHQTILDFDQIIGLLRWLATNDVQNNLLFIKQLFVKLQFYQLNSKTKISLENIQYYDQLNLPLSIIPSNVLPNDIVSYLSRDDLERKLNLQSISYKYLIEYYLFNSNQHQIFSNNQTAKILLSFISKYINQFNRNDSDKLKDILIKIPCIPTTKGIQLANKSYFKCINLNEDIPIIELYIPELSNENKDEYSVSIEFLKSIGCRSIDLSNQIIETNQLFIENLLEKRKTLSQNDLNALKTTECLFGKPFRLINNNQIKKYKPDQLHFSFVAENLDWNELIILDWEQIDSKSTEFLFLKQLGVKQVPNLNDLIQRIHYEYEINSKSIENYQLSKSFVFFIQHFREFYSKIWTNSLIEIPFLPSILPQSDQVILSLPQFVFKEKNPFFLSLLPEVVQCISINFDINLIGIKTKPTLTIAFDYLLKNQKQFLNIEYTSKYFNYLNQLDGLNQHFIQQISNIQFIPLKINQFAKISQVFIRSKPEEDSLEKQALECLIDFVDFGKDGNAFLTSLGVTCYPSAENLIEILIQKQKQFFQEIDQQFLKAKLKVYTNCLKQLSIASNLSREFFNEPLRSRLINQSWCLAYQFNQQTKQTIFQIAKPKDIYLDDDHQTAIDVQPLCAPDEPELMKFYEKFGSKWLSEHVKRTLIHQGRIFTSERTENLYELIHHRLDMLFVNNRGEIFDNIDEKRLDLLKKNLSVYECDSIQCQIHFQNQILTLNSNECSSCALEYDKKKVILFVNKQVKTIDFIDLATELTRFVSKKAIDTLVHSISDKLNSPLETLKRRGIPVDRLLKTKQKRDHLSNDIQYEIQQPVKQQTTIQNNKGKSSNVQPQINPVQKLQSEIERNPMTNFGAHRTNENEEMNQLIKTSRSYSEKDFVQKEISRIETNNSCEFIPQSNMIRYEKFLSGIAFYIDTNVKLTNIILEQAQQLAFVLSNLIPQIFSLSIETIHLFRDIDSARIAFNRNGSLFFNVRYFEQIFHDELQESILKTNQLSSRQNVIIRKLINFYYMVTCHELCHNIDANHDLNFLNRLEKVSVYFMDKKDYFISKFSF